MTNANSNFTADLNHAYFSAWYAQQTITANYAVPKPPAQYVPAMRSTYSVLTELAQAIPSVDAI